MREIYFWNGNMNRESDLFSSESGRSRVGALISAALIAVTVPAASLGSLAANEPEKQKVLGLPVTEDEAAFVASQNQRTNSLLATVDAGLSGALRARAAELVPKKPSNSIEFVRARPFRQSWICCSH